jgi:imidazolonepropionase-like amidohydrolase
MRRLTVLSYGLAIGAMASVVVYAQTGPAATPAVIYEGARLILGSASAAPINDGAFVVQNGMITAIGRRGSVTAPAGAARVDLTGKTVIPALIDVHAHFGYNTIAGQGVRSENYTPENLYDQFQREAFYGVGTVHDGGTAVVPLSLQFQADQKAGKYPGASRYVFAPGITPPDGGPDEWLIAGTRPLHANFEVIKAPEARKVVQELAAKNIRNVKLWVGDRNGTYPAMPHEVYDAIIDEAHKHDIKVHSHAMIVRDQKDILRAGADVIVHIVTTAKIDEETIALIRQRKPYWSPNEASTYRRNPCDPFNTQTLPDTTIAPMCKANAVPAAPATGESLATREAMIQANFQAMRAAGARIVVGTDAGVRNVLTFGSGAHSAMAAFVMLGMTPAQAIEAGTALAAESIGLTDVGRLATGTHADFVVLNANPLDNIANTRQISAVYLGGVKIDRDAMQAKWKNSPATR